MLAASIATVSSFVQQRQQLSSPSFFAGDFPERPAQQLFSTSFEDDNVGGSGGLGGGGGWNLETLRSRAAELESTEFLQEKKWREADCASGVQVSMADWVRRLDVQYPLAALGTVAGSIALTHLETGEMLAVGERKVGPDLDPTDDLEQAMRHMYGEWDGKGTVAIAFNGDLICEANRDGGVHFWRLDASSTSLVYQGSMKALEGILVTCLHLDDEFLWIGSSDGKVQAFPLDSSLPLALQTEPELRWQFRSMVISLSLTPDVGLGVVTTVGGTVELISLEDDDRSLCTFYPPYDDDDEEVTSVHALSAVLVAHKEQEDDGIVPYSIAVGGNDGSLILQPIQMDEDGELDEYRPFMGSLQKFKPRHQGAVKCLANPIPGLLISASHDGSMRVWDVETKHCIYQFVGYNVFLGSLWTDGWRIVSDGSDTTVIVHDFKKDADSTDRLDDEEVGFE